MKEAGFLGGKWIRRSVVFMTLIVCLAGFSQAQSRYRVSKKDQGYTNITQGSVLIPSNQYPLGFGVETINGYQVNPQFSVGIGVGINAYQEDLFLPLFLDSRYFFMPGNAPFLCADAGYALTFNDLQGGPLGHAGAGYRLYFSNSMALNLMVGYKVQRFRESVIGQLGEVSQTRQVSSVALTAGLSF
jgi:hypothetical protein